MAAIATTKVMTTIGTVTAIANFQHSIWSVKTVEIKQPTVWFWELLIAMQEKKVEQMKKKIIFQYSDEFFPTNAN